MDSPWIPMIYQYGIGGAVFFAGIIIALRKKMLTAAHHSDRGMLIQLIAGFLFYFLLHFLWMIIVLS